MMQFLTSCKGYNTHHGQHNCVCCLAHVINLVTKAAFWPFASKKDNEKASKPEDHENEDLDDEEAGDNSVLEPNVVYER